jgi:UDP-N-acetylmuramate--alanine ligase
MPAEGLWSTPRRIHIVGVGGAGMSGVAVVLAAMGHRVTGSDQRASPVTDRLAAHGIGVAIGHRAENLGDAEVVTASPAVAGDNPELTEARARGLPVVPRAGVLAMLSATRRTVAVAGTHGKTTTASMLVVAVGAAGMAPSFLVGADVGDLRTNAALDDGEWMVLEADESYGAFGALAPEMTVLTSVEPDHLDHYGTLEALRAAFGRLLGATTGRSLVSADEPGAASLGAEFGARSVGESRSADYRIVELELAAGSSRFGLVGPEGPLGAVRVATPGRHNVANASLAVAAAVELGAPFEVVAAAMAAFRGAPRRYEQRGERGGVSFVDDYGHLPTEVAAVIATARGAGFARVVAVFQPHRFTRTQSLAGQFAHAFDGADVLVVTEVYGAGEAPIPGVSGRLVADAVAAANPALPLHYAPTREELRSVVASMLRPGDLCLTLGAGDLTTLPDELMAALAR